MKRRSFLSLLGLAPAVPLIAKEVAKAVPVTNQCICETHGHPIVSPWLHDFACPLYRSEPRSAVRFEKYVDAACMFTSSYAVHSPQEWRK